MHEHGKAVGVLLAGLLVASCGGGDTALYGSCRKEPSLDGTKVLCVEAEATTATALQAARDATCGAAKWSNGVVCPHDDRLGGCLTAFIGTPSGTVQHIFWYYPSEAVQTAADVMNLCVSFSETFVPADGGFPPR